MTCAGVLAAPPAPAGLKLYVAPGGRDAWTGSLPQPNRTGTDGPLASLAGARDAIRALKGNLPPGGVCVEFAAGSYELPAAVDFAAEDSGGTNSPIEYRAAAGAQVRLSGGRRVEGFRAVTDPAVLARLAPAARGKVLAADLKALGLTDWQGINGPGSYHSDRSSWSATSSASIPGSTSSARYSTKAPWAQPAMCTACEPTWGPCAETCQSSGTLPPTTSRSITRLYVFPSRATLTTVGW